MKKLIATFIGALSLAASASTVNWGVDNDFNMVLQDGVGTALLRDGSLVRIGTFNLTDAAITALAAPTPENISALNAAFVPFGSQTARVGLGGFNGFGGLAAVSSQTLGASNPLLGAQIYIWALKSTTDTSVALSLSTAVQQAIFYRSKAIDPDWQFPTDLQPSPTIDAGDLRNVAGTGLSTGSNVLVGNFVPNNATASGASFNGQPTSAIQLNAVPEPTSAFLVAVGAAGLMMRRRRQS